MEARATGVMSGGPRGRARSILHSLTVRLRDHPRRETHYRPRRHTLDCELSPTGCLDRIVTYGVSDIISRAPVRVVRR